MNKGRRILIAVAILAALVVISFVVFLSVKLAGCSMRTTRAVDDYNALSDELAARSYRRDPDSPGWTLEEGEAAALYIQAYEVLVHSDLHAVRKTSIRTLWAQYPQAWERSQHNAPRGPGTDGVPPACIEAGVPEGYDDPVVSELDADLCELLVEHGKTLELLRRGSRRSDARSPIHVWSDWTVDASGESRDWWVLNQLTWLELLDGYFAAVNGDRMRRLESLFVVMRSLSDFTRGGDFAAYAGAANFLRTPAAILQSVVLDPNLTQTEAETIHLELAYLFRQPPELQGALEADWLDISSLYHRADRIQIPTSIAESNRPTTNPLETVSLGPATLKDLTPHWERTLALMESPYPERLAGYASNEQSMEDAFFIAKIAAIHPGTWDARMTLTTAHLKLLHVVTADALFRFEHDRSATTLEELTAEYEDLAIVDPLTDEPFVLEIYESSRVLRSAALDGDRRIELNLGHEDKSQPLEERLRIELPR